MIVHVHICMVYSCAVHVTAMYQVLNVALPYFDANLAGNDRQWLEKVNAAEDACLKFIQERCAAGDIKCLLLETVHATTGLSLRAKFLQSLHAALQVSEPTCILREVS